VQMWLEWGFPDWVLTQSCRCQPSRAWTLLPTTRS